MAIFGEIAKSPDEKPHQSFPLYSIAILHTLYMECWGLRSYHMHVYCGVQTSCWYGYIILPLRAKYMLLAYISGQVFVSVRCSFKPPEGQC